jgi:NADPH:quinone reductase-like Zn-dependent oxidoreductase
MRALTYSNYGSPSVLGLNEIAPPVLGDTDVLVRVVAASVTAWDRDNLVGALANRGMLGWRRPGVAVLGGDLAGRVVQVGPGVTRWRPGDAVLGDLCNSGWGAFAELARAPESALVEKPEALGFAEAAALPQAAVMALLGIRDHGQVRAGQRVLVNGAGGGVGSFAVQLAKLQGAEVTGVDAEAKLALVKELGADHVLDYKRQDYTAAHERFDFVLDSELHRSAFDCLRVLTPRGRLTVLGGSTARLLQAYALGRWLSRGAGKQVSILFHDANKDLDQLAALAARGKLRSPIEHIYPFADAAQALQRMCEGAIAGKAVIRIADE